MAALERSTVTVFVLLLLTLIVTKAIHLPSPLNVGYFGVNGMQKLYNRRVEQNEKEKTNIEFANSNRTTSIIGLVDLTASAVASSAVAVTDQLSYMQTMTAGALSRAMAQTLMHPANTYKTLLQIKGSEKKGGILTKLTPERLFRGIDAQFICSIPHGALYFFVIDRVKSKISGMMSLKFSYLQDFAASTISTVFCSVVSTPQMVLTDRLMAGVYPSFPVALKSILSTEGIAGFYTGWWPALAQKIPSYGLTWMFFQQLKRSHEDWFGSAPNGEVSFILGAVAAAASVTVMIPMDTIKTRLVIQMAGNPRPYLGVKDCFVRILKEEGVGSFYRSLLPRLMSVVPMTAIQFGLYETFKKRFLHFNKEQRIAAASAFNKRTFNRVSKVGISAAAIARIAAKRSAKVSLNINGKLVKLRKRRRLNGEHVVKLTIPEEIVF